ncbi:hypothetical protein [Mycolicibacterium monacense]|uniref:Uncharacterized protein n=2 Tax=unclassified Mycobacterium TaxID=2642494 RepID=A0A5Q5BGV9_MYCSS|nr:hypothetical protein [Mycolicibacterium monacense]OBF46958.1 hypothetical protein A5778_25835 [Mycolicibacterium monacense]
MLHDILAIDIQGDVDQAGLERLRTHLGLKKFGRLTDEWDQQFGYRKIDQPGGHYAKIVLYRDFDGSWEVQVMGSENLDLGTDGISALKRELLNGMEAAGFLASVRDEPTSGLS